MRAALRASRKFSPSPAWPSTSSTRGGTGHAHQCGGLVVLPAEIERRHDLRAVVLETLPGGGQRQPKRVDAGLELDIARLQQVSSPNRLNRALWATVLSTVVPARTARRREHSWARRAR